MSFLSNILHSSGLSHFEFGRRTSRDYQRLDESHSNGLGNSRRFQPGKAKRIVFWSLIPLILLLGFIYVETGHELVHFSTAAKCQWTVSGLQYPVDHGNSTNDMYDTDESDWARIVLPGKLMDQLDDYGSNGSSARILHQSWKNELLPERFQRWSRQWRKLHGSDWTYVLWTDADNLQLVERYYPQFLKTYKALPREIYRADMARNMYMHRFGGVYADLDLVPLSPLPKHLPVLSSPTPLPIHIAYVGHMSGDDFEHSIPNAFMASTPAGHPFWLEPLHFVQDHFTSDAHNYPEALTGPVALRTCVKKWEAERELRRADGIFDELTVLENGKIYPFSWWDSPFTDQCICRPQSSFFNPLLCNSLYPNAWTITYWSHSWEDFSW